MAKSKILGMKRSTAFVVGGIALLWFLSQAKNGGTTPSAFHRRY